jgi:hypothetical protein
MDRRNFIALFGSGTLGLVLKPFFEFNKATSDLANETNNDKFQQRLQDLGYKLVKPIEVKEVESNEILSLKMEFFRQDLD